MSHPIRQLGICLLCAGATNGGAATLESLQAFTLGDDHVEYYEAHVVLNSKDQRRDEDAILKHVRALCSDFPKLDTYLVRVFDSLEVAQEFGRLRLSTLSANRAPDAVRRGFVLELSPSRDAVVAPLAPNARSVSLPRNWCRH